MINIEHFTRLAATYNVIPLVWELLADIETPITIAARLATAGKYFLLESVDGGETWGRYSILGFHIRKELLVRDGLACLRQDDYETPLPGNPVDAIQRYLAAFRAYPAPGLPRFFGGAVGYFAFEAVQYFERCGQVKPNQTAFPDAEFFLADHLIVFDRLRHTMQLVCCVHPGEYESLASAYQSGLNQLDTIADVLRQPVPPRLAAARPGEPPALTANLPREQYEAIVERAKRYIQDGDIIQVVLAQHFTAPVAPDHLDLYRALRHINPSPYLYLLSFGDGRAIVGSSPEVMVRVTDDLAETRPIAGTRPRGQTPAEDERLAAELLADPKERAEHVMLVDLARNDLGRIARIGTVNVDQYMTIERYSHVMHIVSHVSGRLRPECDALDVFKATFPAGTLSGAPKVRAMEIIQELEPTRRGPYGGALGYIAYGGRIMDLAITIRTWVLDGTSATVTAGAGIVFDSVPAREYDETRHKSRGMRRALTLVHHGLRLGEELP
jgi:anthranilate synthase component 1